MKQTRPILGLLLGIFLSFRCSNGSTEPEKTNLVEGTLQIESRFRGTISGGINQSINLPKTENVFEFQNLYVIYRDANNTGRYLWQVFVSTSEGRFTEPDPPTELNLAPPYHVHTYNTAGNLFRFFSINTPNDSTIQKVLFYMTTGLQNYGRLVSNTSYQFSTDQDSLFADLQIDFSYMVLTDSTRTFPSL